MPQCQLLQSSLVKELFSPENLDNQNSTDTLEKIAAIGIAALVVEMENEKKSHLTETELTGQELT